jgi:hypothetical protein
LKDGGAMEIRGYAIIMQRYQQGYTARIHNKDTQQGYTTRRQEGAGTKGEGKDKCVIGDCMQNKAYIN